MAPVPPSVDMALASQALPASGPRLWRLVCGLACLALAGALLVAHGAGLAWASAIGETGFLSALLGIVGLAFVLQAWRSDLFRLHSARVVADGIGFQWSHAPSLAGPSVCGERFVAWDGLASIHWREGQQDHDFRQLLELTLHEPLVGHRHQLRLLVSEGRHADRCGAVVALLPASASPPGWMAAHRAAPRADPSQPPRERWR